jgi:hypothetical protein
LPSLFHILTKNGSGRHSLVKLPCTKFHGRPSDSQVVPFGRVDRRGRRRESREANMTELKFHVCNSVGRNHVYISMMILKILSSANTSWLYLTAVLLLFTVLNHSKPLNVFAESEKNLRWNIFDISKGSSLDAKRNQPIFQ